ncbi:hypothetical protein L2E82_47668 [Cichorium intybus]|uniref:Uncharacterized protein n=1 Tax=Cichorium intybus TaxID=13427 RepID=A0ACB8YVZ4_CICIN|nr:hypothetical protein L2E82_47668 [Cichorium intybus]
MSTTKIGFVSFVSEIKLILGTRVKFADVRRKTLRLQQEKPSATKYLSLQQALKLEEFGVSGSDAENKDNVRKLLYMGLYLLIWGEAANDPLDQWTGLFWSNRAHPNEIFAHPRLISIVTHSPRRKKEKRRPSALSLSLTLRTAASAPGPAATVLRLTACRACLVTPVRPPLLPPALVKRFRILSRDY